MANEIVDAHVPMSTIARLVAAIETRYAGGIVAFSTWSRRLHGSSQPLRHDEGRYKWAIVYETSTIARLVAAIETRDDAVGERHRLRRSTIARLVAAIETRVHTSTLTAPASRSTFARLVAAIETAHERR